MKKGSNVKTREEIDIPIANYANIIIAKGTTGSHKT